ncbi:hypothetical protein Tco_0423940 [Tanacetum coccineum]
MDIFTKGALWDYWKLGSDEIEPTNEKPSNLEETSHDDELEIGEIFRIETNLFDYEIPRCKKFKEFNYLLKIDSDLLTKDIEGFKTYEDYKDDWIYEWNEDIPWVHEKPWMDNGTWEEPKPNDGLMDETFLELTLLETHSSIRILNGMKPWRIKYEALRNKATMEGIIDDDGDESRSEVWRRWNVYDDTNHDHEYMNEQEIEERCEVFDDNERLVCNIRRFKMIKYSFRDDEKYVAIKEDEYDDLTEDLAGKKSTMLVKYLQSEILAQ